MKIVILGDNYYIPVENGFKHISKAQAMELYEEGLITQEDVIEYDHD
jgi:hypothetical protein